MYLLHFEGGAVYVGRAVDVIDRLGQHRRTHPDLREVQLRWCTRAELNKLERELIRDAERARLPLRNIDQMSVVSGVGPLEAEVSAVLQKEWTGDPRGINARDAVLREPFNDDQCRPFVARHLRFQAHTAAPAALRVLRTYVNDCLLLPRRTERDFWSLSCLPGTNAARLACISVGRMETLVLTAGGGFVVLAADELTDSARKRHRRALRASDYEAAGAHQVALQASSLAELSDVLEDDDVSHAAAVLSYRVMRKGRTWYSRSHSPLLANDVVA